MPEVTKFNPWPEALDSLRNASSVSHPTRDVLNFHPDRKGNLASHYNENCVLLVPYEPYFGQWDDVICGDVGILVTPVSRIPSSASTLSYPDIPALSLAEPRTS
ncbi:hypothetical protein DPMN_022757 [Dreissena polymorpha]|uniref:Uncharacterized protein n=1 Tax=Dreissena polymorpha TaxID=45954 RepID=A0A9D4NKW6_DREPO|nr:hypothetical protein DPMN_022757 [Dreissena polymorpha]